MPGRAESRRVDISPEGLTPGGGLESVVRECGREKRAVECM